MYFMTHWMLDGSLYNIPDASLDGIMDGTLDSALGDTFDGTWDTRCAQGMPS